MEKMKVLKDVCIGCGACTSICKEVFSMDETEGYAVVTVEEIPSDHVAEALDALEACPTGAIVEADEAEDLAA